MKINRYCGSDYPHNYHVGLYVYKRNRFYTDCTEWSWAKHGKLYKQTTGTGPCYVPIYRPHKGKQMIFSANCAADFKFKTICFNAFDNATTKAEGIVQGNAGISSLILLALFAGIAIGVAIVSLKKNKNDEEK